MKSHLRRCCVLLCLLLYWLPNAGAQVQPVVTVKQIEIRHAGPASVSDDLIRANIRVKVGDPFSRTSVDEDVRSLFKTGFFQDIRVAEAPAEGGVKIIYTCTGKLLLTDIRFTGNTKFSNRELLKKISSKVGQPLNEQKLFSDTQEILKLYQKKGFQKTKVKTSLDPNESAGRGRVTFEITETPKMYIDSIHFEGASAFPQKKLAKVIKTRHRGFWSWLNGSGVLKDDEFEDDLDKLREFYRNEGYIDFELNDKDVRYDTVGTRRMAVHIVLFEGKQYKVGSVAFKGNSLFTEEEIRASLNDKKGLKLKPGDVFTPKDLNKDLDGIQDFYGSRGYIDARVAAIKNANIEMGTIDLVYEVDEKTKSFIERIDIRGNTKTRDKVIRRELAVAPGEVFDMVRVKLSKERIQGTQFFEKVETQVEATDVPNRKNLVVNIEESRKTGNVNVGAGFSSVESVLGFVEVTQGNFDLFNPPYFTGGGQKFRLRAQVGALRRDYVLSFIEPWFLDRKLSFGVELYHRELNFQSALYNEEQTGVGLSLERALGSDFLRGSLRYNIENLGILDVSPLASPELQLEAGHTIVSRMGVGIIGDTRGGGVLPNKGQRTEFLAEMAGGPFGGDADFYKLELQSSWYFKGFAQGHVIELNGRAGVVEEYGSSTRVPLFHRFFLGGVDSLRGFRYPQVGPRDSLGEPIGGDSFFFGSAEYSIPIIEFLRVAAFYDIGNVYAQPYHFNLKNYNDNWGFGIRLNIPRLGPLRLDYGIPISHDAVNGGSGRFQISFGYSRPF
jgi:outer membrane protein insertion porin family